MVSALSTIGRITHTQYYNKGINGQRIYGLSLTETGSSTDCIVN